MTVPTIYRRIVSLLLTAVPLVVLPVADAGDSPKAPAELKFGAREYAAPLSSKTEEGWTGYTIDLCRRIFDRYQERYRVIQPTPRFSDTNVPPRQSLDFYPIQAAERIDALENGRIDILCGATTVTVSRMQRVDFTLLTFVSGTGIMKKAKTDAALLDNRGRDGNRQPRIVYVGCTRKMQFADCTTTESWVTERFGSAVKLMPRKNHLDAFAALQKDEADFYIGDRIILAHRLQNSSHPFAFELAPTYLTFEPYAIAISKENGLLLNVANEVLAELYRNAEKENGIDKIYGNYFKTKKSELLAAMYRLMALPK